MSISVELDNSSRDRETIYEKLVSSSCNEGNWQENETPAEVVEEMVETVSLEGAEVVVLFNREFLEDLIYRKGISPSRILFVADREIEARVASELYKVKTKVFTEEMFKSDKNSLNAMISEIGSEYGRVLTNQVEEETEEEVEPMEEIIPESQEIPRTKKVRRGDVKQNMIDLLRECGKEILTNTELLDMLAEKCGKSVQIQAVWYTGENPLLERSGRGVFRNLLFVHPIPVAQSVPVEVIYPTVKIEPVCSLLAEKFNAPHVEKKILETPKKISWWKKVLTTLFN